MSPALRTALAGFGIFVLGLFVGGVMRPNHEQEAIRMRAQARGWYAVAASMQARVDTQVVELVRTVERTQRVTDTVLRVLREQYPECASVIDTCEQRIRVERDSTARWRVAFQDEKAIADLFRRSADTADAGIGKALGGKSLGWKLFHPELRPGIFAGACYDAEGRWKPCVGGGLTLSWRF